jgi:hypothetical protein
MSNGVVRFYPDTEQSSIIGFSARVTDVPEMQEFQDFLLTNDRTYTGLEAGATHPGVSYAYGEIQPPLDEDTRQRLGKLCVNIGDAGNNYVLAIDNTTYPVDDPREKVIASA